MPRNLRKCLPNTTYHTMSRCIEWRSMMCKNHVKDIMIEVLQKTREIYNYELVFYTIMDNHFHFIIKTLDDEETISRIMQYIKARFTEKFNRKVKRIGPFWNERFKDSIIEDSKDPVYYFNWLLWYLGFNPVRKGKVYDPRNYIYSSINCYLDKKYKSPVKITLHKYFLILGKTYKERLKKFLEFEEAYRKKREDIFKALGSEPVYSEALSF